MAVTSGQTIGVTEATLPGEGRAQRAITHELADVPTMAMFSPPHPMTSAICALFGYSLSPVARHRFHDVAMEAVPTGCGVAAV
eukprot:5157767-Amphidinium_carterae.1